MLSFLLNPWMLLGGLGLAIPIIIEIIFRRRHRHVDLPSMRYLLKNPEQKKIKRQDRLLLILRCLFPFFVAWAMARPSISPDLVGAANQRHITIVVDSTISLGQQAGVSTAFALAKGKMSALVRALPKGNLVSIVTLGHKPEVEMYRSDDLYAAKERIESLKLSHGAASLSEAVNVMTPLLQKDKKPGELQEIYIFSDFQKTTWLKRTEGNADPAASIRGLEDLGDVTLVDVGGSRQFNYFISEFAPVELPLVADKSLNFRCTVDARGTPTSSSPKARLTFLVNGEKKGMQELELASGSKTVTFPVRFPAAGEYLLEASLEGDFHFVDNHRYFLAAVPDAHRVLILDEKVGSVESRYLQAAILPHTRPGMDRLSAFSTRVISPAEIVRENLADYVAVVLLGLERPSQDMIGKLEPYVRDGGNAIFFLNGRLNTYEYNERLFRKGKGILSFGLDKPAAAEKSAPLSLKFSSEPHPLLRESAAPLQGQVLNYMRLTALEPASKVLASFSNESPAVLESSFGRGRVISFCTAAGPPESYLPFSPGYLMFFQNLLCNLVGDPDRVANIETGQQFEEEVLAGSQHVIVRKPDNTKVRLSPELTGGDVPRIRFPNTDQMGLYTISTEGSFVKRASFVVNLRSEEGDLDRLDENELAKLLPRSNWLHAGSSIDAVVERKYSKIELAGALLWLIVGLVTVESFLAARFGLRRG